jgi:hypothetical protein
VSSTDISVLQKGNIADRAASFERGMTEKSSIKRSLGKVKWGFPHRQGKTNGTNIAE